MLKGTETAGKEADSRVWPVGRNDGRGPETQIVENARAAAKTKSPFVVQSIGEPKSRREICVFRIPQRRSLGCRSDRRGIVQVFPGDECRVALRGRSGASFPPQPVGQRQFRRSRSTYLGHRARKPLPSISAGGCRRCVKVRLAGRQKILNRVRRVAHDSRRWSECRDTRGDRRCRISTCDSRRSRIRSSVKFSCFD